MRHAITLSLLLLLLWLPSPGWAQTPATRLNPNTPTARGLVGWWRAMPGFTGGARWYDLTGRNHGTLTNMGTAGTTSGWAPSSLPPGFQMPAEVRFDGTNDGVQIAASALLEPPARTVMLWVKSFAFTSGYAKLVGVHNTGTSIDNSLLITNTGQLAAYLAAATGAPTKDPGTTAMSLGVWYHVAYTYDATAGLLLWVNCQPDSAAGGSAAPAGGLIAANAATGLGFDIPTNANYLTGALQDVRIYNRAVPQAELCQMMRDAQRGEPTLLPPPSLASLLASVVSAAGNKGRFFPFFGQ